jgi:hypothetical protein
MAGFDDFQFLQWNPMPPFDNYDTPANPFAQQCFDCESHPRCRLARADHVEIAVVYQIVKTFAGVENLPVHSQAAPY